MKSAVSIVLSLILIAAPAAATVMAEISDGAWQVRRVEDHIVADPAKTRLVLQPDGGLTASVGCNTLRGKAQVKDKSISIGPMAATRMACPEPLMDLETSFARALQAAASFRQAGDTLELLGQDGSVKVVLSKAR